MTRTETPQSDSDTNTRSPRVDVDASASVWTRYSRQERLTQALLLLVTGAVVVWAYDGINPNLEYIMTAHVELMDLYRRGFPPDVAYTREILYPLLMTVHIAVLGTFLAMLTSIPVALLAAENITPNRVTFLIGSLITTVSRSVNVIIWALIFVIMFGGGALAGVAAITIRSIGFCAKLMSEAIEEIDPGPVEAVQSSGARRSNVLLYGVIPQIKAAVIGISIYRLEINIRGATILGFVGAGGIGVQLQTSINTLQWDKVLTILVAILVVVLVGEYLSAKLRKLVQ